MGDFLKFKYIFRNFKIIRLYLVTYFTQKHIFNMEEDDLDLKTVITKNFITALDHLMDIRKLKSVVEFEEITGFRQQRISGMRKYLAEGNNVKAYFANTDHIYMINQKFNVSLRYLILGEEPIIEIENPGDKNPEPANNSNPQWIQELREEISLLKSKYELLKDRIEFLNEKQKSGL